MVMIVISSIIWNINVLPIDRVMGALDFVRKFRIGCIGVTLRRKPRMRMERVMIARAEECPMSTDHRKPVGVVTCDGRRKGLEFGGR